MAKIEVQCGPEPGLPRSSLKPALGACFFTLLGALVLTRAAAASALTVPDDVATIQAAINALPDTVLIRSGNYSETPTLFAQVTVIGILGDPAFERPVLAGLRLQSSPAEFPRLALRHLEVAGHAYIQNDEWLTYITLDDCHIRAGISDISAFPATAGITLRGCRLEGDAFLKADGSCVLDSCVVEGQLIVGEENCDLIVRDSKFLGNGHGAAISTNGLGSDIRSAAVSGTTVDRYAIGIALYAIESVHVTGCSVRDCLGDGMFVRADIARVQNNRVERCGAYGVVVDAIDSTVAADNNITNCGFDGLFALVAMDGTISGNVVWGCAQGGIRLGSNLAAGVLEVWNNTSCLNAGSGFISVCSVNVDGRYELSGNVAFANGQYGVNWIVPEVSVVGCNDWFANRLGNALGRPPSSEDLTLDPAFCDSASGDFHLAARSPLANRPGCGLVGALGVGCDVTSTLVSRFEVERIAAGIRIVWEVADGSTAGEVRVERSDVGDQGPWTRPVMEHSRDGRAQTELDRTATRDRTYWYRLVAMEAGTLSVLGSPVMIGVLQPDEFRLGRVGPSPSAGPVRIEFELPATAAIELCIFDVQGRLVASPARGVWPAGAHAVEWSGRAGSATAAGGVYLVRYRYPGGQATQRLVRML